MFKSQLETYSSSETRVLWKNDLQQFNQHPVMLFEMVYPHPVTSHRPSAYGITSEVTKSAVIPSWLTCPSHNQFAVEKFVYS